MAANRVRPDEFDIRKSALDTPPAGADLHYQQPTGIQMRSSTPQYLSHEPESVGAARQGDARLVAVLPRQAPHARGGDVRRVADDEIVAAPGQGREHVGSDEPDAAAEP